MIKYIYKFFLFWPSFQLLFLSSDLPDCVCKFAIYHLHYKEKCEIIEFVYNIFLLQPSCKQIFLFNALSDCIIKFTSDYLHYKKIYKIINFAYKPFFYQPFSKLIESAYNFFLLQSLWKLLSLPSFLFNYIVKFVLHHLHYKEKSRIVKAIHNLFFQSLFKLILLFDALFYYIIKIMNPLHNMLNISKY